MNILRCVTICIYHNTSESESIEFFSSFPGLFWPQRSERHRRDCSDGFKSPVLGEIRDWVRARVQRLQWPTKRHQGKNKMYINPSKEDADDKMNLTAILTGAIWQLYKDGVPQAQPPVSGRAEGLLRCHCDFWWWISHPTPRVVPHQWLRARWIFWNPKLVTIAI